MSEMTEDQIEAASDLIRARNCLNDMLNELAEEDRPMSISLLLGRDQIAWDTTPPIPKNVVMHALKLMKEFCEESLSKIV